MSKSGITLLGVSGSPRLKSTHFTVNAALEYARERHSVETDYVTVHRRAIGFCMHCDYCTRKKKGCVLDDGMTEIYDRMLKADAWILGTPVYQGQMSGQMKTLLDRCRGVVARDPKAFCGKVGAAVAVGGDRSGGQEPTIQSLIDFFIINEMIPVGGGSFGANLGAAVWSRDKGVEGAEADEGGMAAIRRVVDRLVDVTRLVHT